jgi:hypothetical protein
MCNVYSLISVCMYLILLFCEISYNSKQRCTSVYPQNKRCTSVTTKSLYEAEHTSVTKMLTSKPQTPIFNFKGKLQNFGLLTLDH